MRIHQYDDQKDGQVEGRQQGGEVTELLSLPPLII